ncbi:uncharacterized protein LOC129591738 [Paramacrobiotus metropolitanus]|uniref:uncharacterized protein LOC129591738 n=1 Tax=Paramacrobiotus metropolitanus TaxID=2943436 RepID=UPI002445A177|nr:uncharacterized protein LOC129591738 [Paramacrobiotus metropolitanus]
MPATSLYFRKLFSGARELNYGNTVLVQRDHGQWWLGYVQDIDGDKFLVDFDAADMKPQWIHSSCLWPHPSLRRPDVSRQGETIHAALRQTNGGPLVLRKAIIVHNSVGGFFTVRMAENDSAASPANRLVLWSHIATALPMPGDGGSFFQRSSGFLYRKYAIPYPQAHRLPDLDFLPAFVARTCQLSLPPGLRGDCQFSAHASDDCMLFQCTGLHPDSGSCPCYYINVGGRLFARLGSDTVTFVCAEMHRDRYRQSMFWDEEDLKSACDSYLTARLATLPVKMDTTPSDGTLLGELPHPILGGIFRYLDVDSQLRTRRVCVLWRLLSTSYVDNRDILLDVCAQCDRQPYGDKDLEEEYDKYLKYNLGALLQRIQPHYTRTLALTEGRNHLHNGFALCSKMSSVRRLLHAESRHLPLIIVKNGRDVIDVARTKAFLVFQRNDLNGQLECDELAGMMTVCDELMLINFTASEAIQGSACAILWADDGVPQPDVELDHIRDSPDRLEIIIPMVRFHSTQTAAEQARILLATADAHCPAASQRVLQKVTAIHARWMLTLVYPEQWSVIRDFLKLFNCLGPDDDPQRWDTMDLRQLDIPSLTNVTFVALDACFKD